MTMKNQFFMVFIVLSLFFMSIPLGATPLRMEYSVEELPGGSFQYSFSLILDNNDGSWFSGQGFDWIIFGDNPYPYSSSPLTDFVGNPSDLPIGPFTKYTISSGDHSGPTLVASDPYIPKPWIPSYVGDSISWSGISSANLYQGSLLFTNLWGNVANETITTNTTNPAHREVAYRVDPVANFTCAGFEPPCDSPNVALTVKKNKCVPLKTELLDKDGFPITDADIESPPVLILDNFSGANQPSDTALIDGLSVGMVTDGNQFVFIGGRWCFNLKVKDYYTAPGTYTFKMVSGNPNEYVIEPTGTVTIFVEK